MVLIEGNRAVLGDLVQLHIDGSYSVFFTAKSFRRGFFFRYVTLLDINDLHISTHVRRMDGRMLHHSITRRAAVDELLVERLRAKDGQAIETWIALLLGSSPPAQASSPIYGLVQAAGRMRRPDKPSNFPRLWNLFPLLLPRKVRERVYEPAHQELLEDYLLARKSYRTKAARRWITFCFTVRTAVLVLQSVRAWIGDKALRALLRIGMAMFGGQLLRDLMRIFRP